MTLLLIAGLLQLVVAVANLPLVRILDFGREHSRLTPIVRQIHEVHHMYLGLLLVVFAAISVAFPRELIAGEGLGSFFSWVLAIFWGARLLIQRFYYDRAFLRQHRAGDAAFTLVFAFLFTVYAAAAAGGLR